MSKVQGKTWKTRLQAWGPKRREAVESTCCRTDHSTRTLLARHARFLASPEGAQCGAIVPAFEAGTTMLKAVLPVLLPMVSWRVALPAVALLASVFLSAIPGQAQATSAPDFVVGPNKV